MSEQTYRLISMSDHQIEEWSNPSLECPPEDSHEFGCIYWHTPIYWDYEIAEFRGYLDTAPFTNGQTFAPAFPHFLRPLVRENLLQIKACLRALENAHAKGCQI